MSDGSIKIKNVFKGEAFLVASYLFWASIIGQP